VAKRDTTHPSDNDNGDAPGFRVQRSFSFDAPEESQQEPDDMGFGPGPDETIPEEPAWLNEAPSPDAEYQSAVSGASPSFGLRNSGNPQSAVGTFATRETILSGLNPQQREAVETTSGPLLIIAGPGSGKTRVLTHRIAYLIEIEKVWPSRICAVTFTNKAAGEMKHRLEWLIGPMVRDLTIGTFHSLGVRILRQDADAIGYKRDFAIYDDDDQISLVKQAIKDIGLDEKLYPPRSFL